MRTLLTILLLSAAALVASPDTNISGKWTGTFNMSGPDGQGGKETGAVLLLKQTGADITGTVGPDEGEQHNISKGKIEGDKITLVCEEEGHTIQFNLVLAADRISGDVKLTGDGGEERKAKIDVTRSK